MFYVNFTFFGILNYFSRDNQDKNATTMAVLDRHYRMPANNEILSIRYHCLFHNLHCTRVQSALCKICHKLHYCMVLVWITIIVNQLIAITFKKRQRRLK